MPLFLHRSNRAEHLVRALARQVAKSPPADPFEPIPIVVGARGMERWIRNQLATHQGVAANLAFPFPRPALDGAVAALLGELPLGARFWERDALQRPWEPAALTWRLPQIIAELLQHHGDDPAFQRVADYLADNARQGATERADHAADRVVSARELSFAGEVATCLDNWARQRPDIVADYFQTGAQLPAGGDERWLAAVLQACAQHIDSPHPILALADLQRRTERGERLQRIQTVLHVFGLSTIRREELRTLALLTRQAGLRAHLYLLSPSAHWFRDTLTRGELASQLRAARHKPDDDGATTLQRQRALIDARAAGNPLLAELGRPSRDVQAMLEMFADHYLETDAGEDVLGAHVDPVASAASTGAPPTMLQLLQRDLLVAQAAPALDERREERLAANDRSLLFAPCHGPLRQVETLRDELWAAFEADPTLEPRHVLVMTPDISTHAPIVAAVFGQGAGAAPPIPVEIADMGLRDINPVAEVLLAVMEFAEQRVTVSRLLQLLQLEPLRRRYDLAQQDMDEVQRLLVDAGARWGIDEADRASVSQPALHQNTIAHAMERIALGALFLDEGSAAAAGCDTLPAPATQAGATPATALHRQPFVPFDAVDGASIDCFGRLYASVQALLHHRAAVTRPATAQQWNSRFEQLLSDLTETSDAAAWLLTKVRSALVDICAVATAAAPEQQWSLQAMRQLLQEQFSMRASGDRVITGAVTVCAMEPMRSVPFKIVALLGMDDNAFPRQVTMRAWDPMRRGRQLGEHERRDVDRHLLLEALLSARDRLLVLWTGFDAHSGEPLPPAVPIRELSDHVTARFTKPVRPQAEATGPDVAALTARPAALQPWSASLFEAGDNAPQSYDVLMCDAAAALRDSRASAHPQRAAEIIAGQLAEVDAAVTPLPQQALASEVAAALTNPSKALLRTRFDLRLQSHVTEVMDREPLEWTGLRRWQLRNEALGAERARAEDLTDWLTARGRAEGSLPIGPSAAEHVAREVATARELQAKAASALGAAGQPLASITRAVRHDCLVKLQAQGACHLVSGDIDAARDPLDARAMLHVHLAAGGLKPSAWLTAWLQLLLAAASPKDVAITGALIVTLGSQGKLACRWLEAPSPRRAMKLLRAVVSMWSRCLQAPVPLFNHTSATIAEQLCAISADATWVRLSPRQRNEVRTKARASWSESKFSADVDDVWVRALYDVTALDDGLAEPREGQPQSWPWVQLAVRLWSPLLTATSDFDDRPQAGDAADDAASNAEGAR